MSEEEKKAINYLKNDVVRWLDKGRDLVVIDIEENDKLHSILDLIEKQDNKIKFLLDNEKSLKEMNRNQMKIIEKQQKEIEELKKPKYMMNFETGTITTIDNNFISKDKIREKIKELEITRNSCVTDNGFTIMSVVISNFKELLEEK